MNLHKEDPLLAEFERSLGRMLSNWTRRFSPPRDARAKLMLAAGKMEQDREKSLQKLLLSKQRQQGSSQELASLFYAPQLSYIGALIHF